MALLGGVRADATMPLSMTLVSRHPLFLAHHPLAKTRPVPSRLQGPHLIAQAPSRSI